jgi:hypothetical protein
LRVYSGINVHTIGKEPLGALFVNQSTLKLYEKIQTEEVEDRRHQAWEHEGESSLLEVITRQKVCEDITE